MPGLEDILKKTKGKYEQVRGQTKVARTPPSIATDDRPDRLAPSPANITSIHVEKISNKVATNQQQSGNKVATKPATNQQQSGNKIESPEINWQQSSNTTSNTICNKVATKQQQTGNKVATKSSFSELVGLQRDIVIFICHECRNSRSRITESLTLEHIAKPLKRSTGAVRTTIQRLEKKGCLVKVEFKNGRGGWSRYEVPDSIYHDVLRSETGNKAATNWQQNSNKVATKLATELATTTSSSSSDLKTTTTNGRVGDEWEFDTTAYRQFGFGKTQIKQLAALGTISAADVEQSLIEFTHDLENNALPRMKGNKINFLMGLLRSGHSYVPEAFKTEQEATISEMARRGEARRKNLLEAKFGVWEASLSEDDRRMVLDKMPPSLMSAEKAHGILDPEVRSWYLDYFIKHVKES